MKRTFCLLLALLLVFSLGAQSFADDVLYCRICGKQIPTDSNYCPYCAAAVVHSDVSVSTATHVAGKSPSPATAVPGDPGPFNSNIRTSASGKLRVTKSPTSESVPYGGSCLFIAHADNASSITWYIANADATVICEASEAAAVNSGLYVSGSKTDTLSLSGIPSWMNGYQVQACFSSSEGKVYTDVARIWTYEEQPKRECWSYWDLVAFCYANPWAWDYFFPGMFPGGPDVDNAIVVGPDGESVAGERPHSGPNAIAIHVGHEVDPDPNGQAASAPEGFNPGGQAGPAPANFNPGGQADAAPAGATVMAETDASQSSLEKLISELEINAELDPELLAALS